METVLASVGTVFLCGGAVWLWHLAHDKLSARLMLIALWLVLLAMGLILGHPFNLIMGAATVMMALIIWGLCRPWSL